MKKRNVVSIVLVVVVVMVIATTVAVIASPKYQGLSAAVKPPLPSPELKALVAQVNYHRCGTRRCFDDNGTAYVVVRASGNSVRVYKETGVGTFTEQDGGDRPSATTIYDVDSRFDATLIHVVYYDYDGADYDIKYVTFNTTDDQWGAPEEATVLDRVPTAAYCRASISLDSNDKPHVVYTRGGRIAGTTYAHLKYKNKTGASWSAEENVHLDTEKKHRIDPTLGHESDNRLVAVWKNVTDSLVGARTRSSAGAWDTLGTVKTSSANASITIDPNDGKQVALKSSSNLYCVTGTQGANPSWSDSVILDGSADDPSITKGGFGGCHLYIIYEKTTTRDIMMVVKNGTWSDPIELQDSNYPTEFVMFDHPIAQDPATADDFDYSWNNSQTSWMYWEEYFFAVPVPTAGISPGGLIF